MTADDGDELAVGFGHSHANILERHVSPAADLVTDDDAAVREVVR